MLRLVVIVVLGFGGVYFLSINGGKLFSTPSLTMSANDTRAEAAAALGMSLNTLKCNISTRRDSSNLRLRLSGRVELLEHGGQSVGPITNQEIFYFNYNGIAFVNQNIQLRDHVFRGDRVSNTNSKIIPNSCMTTPKDISLGSIPIVPMTCHIRAHENDDLIATVGIFAAPASVATVGPRRFEFCQDIATNWFEDPTNQGTEFAFCVLLGTAARGRGLPGPAAGVFVFQRSPDNTAVQVLK